MYGYSIIVYVFGVKNIFYIDFKHIVIYIDS